MFTVTGYIATTGKEDYKMVIGGVLDTVTAIALFVIGSLIIKNHISANPTAPYYLFSFAGFSSSPVLLASIGNMGDWVKKKVTG